MDQWSDIKNIRWTRGLSSATPGKPLWVLCAGLNGSLVLSSWALMLTVNPWSYHTCRAHHHKPDAFLGPKPSKGTGRIQWLLEPPAWVMSMGGTRMEDSKTPYQQIRHPKAPALIVKHYLKKCVAVPRKTKGTAGCCFSPARKALSGTVL